MKNKKILLIVFIFLIIIFIFSFFYINNHRKKTIAEEMKFVEKCAFKDIDDEWTYYMCVDYDKDDLNKKIFSATFGGINMKYTSLKDHYIEVLDENNNIIDKIDTNYVSLANGQSTKNEMREINLFLEEKKFNTTININDLKNLKTKYIDKQLLVDMYNEAYNSMSKPVGKYISNSFAGGKISENGEEYKYQIVYILDYGNISKLNIELIYNDGTYLSDLIKNNKATQLQEKMYNKLIEIQQKIIKENSFTSGIDKSEFLKLENLNKILKELENNS